MSEELHNELVALPLGRVRKLMKEDGGNIRAVTQEASLLVAKAAELFVESLTARALECKTGDGKLAFSDLGALCSVPVSPPGEPPADGTRVAQLQQSQPPAASIFSPTQCHANGQLPKSWQALARGRDATCRT